MAATNLSNTILSTPEEAYLAFKSFVSQFDPLELLSQLTLTFIFTQKDFISEDSDEARWARFIEFTAGYLVTLPKPENPLKRFDGSQIEKFESLLRCYFDSFVSVFLSSQPGTEEERASHRLLQSARIHSLWVRGDAYPHQFFLYAQELYSQHDSWFTSYLGFTITDAVRIVYAVREELVKRVNKSADDARKRAPVEAQAYTKEAKDQKISRKELESRVAIGLHYGAAKTLQQFTLEDLVTISGLDKSICLSFLKRMSQPFGFHNTLFPMTFTEAAIAPWDYNTLEERPFIQHEGFYWLFTNPMIASVLFHTFFFDLMADKSYKATFEKTRGDFVEHKVRQYMERIFPAHMILSNPAYQNGEEFSDVTVLHDGKILIFQYKAKGLVRNARIGADFKKLRSDMQAAIRTAFDQGVRARKYIRSKDEPKLKINGMTLCIDGKMITDIYLINVTTMPLLPFASRFENIEDALGLFPGKGIPILSCTWRLRHHYSNSIYTSKVYSLHKSTSYAREDDVRYPC